MPEDNRAEYEIVQLLQVYGRLAVFGIASGERPRAGETALPENTPKKAKERAEGEAERVKAEGGVHGEAPGR